MCDWTCRPRVSRNCNLPITGEGRGRRGRACAVTLVSHEARHTDDADGCARASGRCIPIIYCWGFHPRGKYPRFLLLVLIVFDVFFHVKVSDLKSTWENTFKNKIKIFVYLLLFSYPSKCFKTITNLFIGSF